MPPNEGHSNAVMFVCGRDTDGSIQPIGTTFLVAVPGSNDAWWPYFVTAGHVVRDGKPTWIRFRHVDGSPPSDIPAGDWVPHPWSDIAATPFELESVQGSGVIAQFVESAYFDDVWPVGFQVIRGQRVYFIGLLAHVRSMIERNIPMMRTGSIGALYQENIPVKDRRPDGTVYDREEPMAHLIDTFSRGGFSGAPLYAEYVNPLPQTKHDPFLWGYASLLGVIIGHFGSPGDNAGVAVAVPVEGVRDLLDHPDLLAWRERKDAEMKTKREDERRDSAADLDSAGDPGQLDDAAEYDRFEDLTKKLVQVPKPELDAERKKDEEGSS